MAWISFNDAFLSIIEPPFPGNNLLVRGRVRGDIERVFPNAAVTETPNRDYRFRAFIDRREVAKAIAQRIMGIHYGNFKSSVTEQDRHDAYFGCWSEMHRLQWDRVHQESAVVWGELEGQDALFSPEDLNESPTRKKCQNRKRTPRRHR